MLEILETRGKVLQLGTQRRNFVFFRDMNFFTLMTPGTRWKANSTLQKHPAANVACCCTIFTLRIKKSQNKIRALLLVLLPSTHKTSKFFSFSLSCLNPNSPNLNLQKLSKDLTPQNSTSQPKKKHSLQGFRFTEKFKITQNQTIEIHTIYRSRVKYIPSAQRDETSREAKRRDEAAKKEKQNNSERGERERSGKEEFSSRAV
jgi:hypothetical protein